MVLAVIVALALLLGSLGWAFTPSVGDLAARVRARDARAGAPFPGAAPPPRFVAALLATEDARYFSDPGVDPLGLVRGAYGTVTGASDAGGATLDQQLAKLVYTGGRSGPLQVAEQLVLAIKIDARYGKAQVLDWYASTVYFGDGATGLTDAAKRYFGLRPAQLSWAQASLLAGLVQAPSAYDPLTHRSLAKQRQQHVLSRLVATHHLTAAQARTAFAAPLHLAS